MLRNVGVDLERNQFHKLVGVMDQNQDGRIDIDEFMSFITRSSTRINQSKNYGDYKQNLYDSLYNGILRSIRIDPRLIFKTFLKFPSSFMKSLTAIENLKGHNMPSDVVKLKLHR